MPAAFLAWIGVMLAGAWPLGPKHRLSQPSTWLPTPRQLTAAVLDQRGCCLLLLLLLLWLMYQLLVVLTHCGVRHLLLLLLFLCCLFLEGLLQGCALVLRP